MPTATRPARTATMPAVTTPAEVTRPAMHHYSYLRDSILYAGMGTVGYAGAPLLGAGHTTTWAITGGCAFLAGTTFFRGRVTSQRTQISDRCTSALTGILGKNLHGVKITRWDSRWGTIPERITVDYDASLNDADPKFTQTITDTLGARTGLAFKVKTLNREHCRLVLVRNLDKAAVTSAQQQRTETLVTDLIPTANVDKILTDDQGNPTRIEVSHKAAHKLAARGYQNRITRAISASLPGRWRAKWDTEQDTVVFSLRPEFPSNLWIQPITVDPTKDPLKTYRQVRIPYADDEDGNQVEWVPARDPHFLCIGPTGSGKTSTEHNILETVAQYGWPIWVADGKGIEFLGFRAYPNVQIVATSTTEQMAVIHRAWQVMEERYNLIIGGLAREEDFEPLMVFIDEWADMRAAITLEYARTKVKGMPTKCPIFDEFDSIARKGRTSRVHMLVSLQRPDVELFGKGESRDNFRCRISMGKLSPQGAQMMWGDVSIGIGIPSSKVGRGTTLNAEGNPVEVQSYRAPDPRKAGGDPEQMELLERLVPAERRHKLLVIDPPVLDDLDCEEGQEPKPPSYDDFVEAPWREVDEIPEWREATVEFTEEQAAEARRRSSPSAILGIGAEYTGRRRTSPVTVSHVSDREAPADEFENTTDDVVDEFEGYGPAQDTSARNVQVGDLVLIDPEDDHWGVVDEEPDDDFDDGIAIPWRDDADEEGLLSLGFGVTITIRRPLDYEE
ncbi:type IV secretory system conjugative DNA transfer family protein [Luteococcus sp.]|uniref:type IV secretory system conjugative DNA transfer family protein n=1 Tax=Luteococcus sp. TaxID=1969402 RepID=UPI003735ED51